MTQESPKGAQHKREPVTSEQAEAARGRILGLRDVLAGHFIAKDRILDLMMIAAVSREPLLLVGPPGTAKSDLVVKFCQALGVTGGDYFEYMLTRFTEPSEILGPVDINALRDGRYLRRDEGRLTRARVAFLDEIFKANSAILNLLLTIINERKSYQDGKPVDVPLEVLFGATNEIPEQGELQALSDRFSLKVLCQSVQTDHFTQLVDLGLKAEGYRLRGVAPWADQRCSLEDFGIANQFLAQQFSSERTKGTGAHQTVLNDRETFFPAELFGEFKRIIRAMPVDFRVTVSDRKVIRLYRLIRTRAWLFHGGLVRTEDLGILEHAGDTLPQMETLAKKIPLLLGGD
jgi:MoxR-like ATPase